jgi:hypothetical protein
MGAFPTMKRSSSIGSLVVALAMSSPYVASGQYTEPYTDDDEGSVELVALAVIGSAIAASTPFWGPVVLTGDDYSMRGYFPEYPYQHGMQGNMLIDGPFPTDPFTWSIQAKTEYANNFIGFSRVDTSLLLESTHRVGFDTEFNYWRESMDSGQQQDFWTGDANLLFRFAQAEWLQTRAGIGFNWLAEDGNSEGGFNFTYLADLFIQDPLIVSAEFDWGTLGSETLLHTRVTTGAQWHRAELFIGYDYFDIGQTQTNSMIAGFRFWN